MGNRINEIRQHKGLSNYELADMCGLNRVTVIKAEKQDIKTSKMSISTYMKIAEALETSVYDLMADGDKVIEATPKMIVKKKIQGKDYNLVKVREGVVRNVAKLLDVVVYFEKDKRKWKEG